MVTPTHTRKPPRNYTPAMAPPRRSSSFMAIYGYDVLLGSIAAFYVLMVPYTKVEESFNVQAMHDILYHGHQIENYDHLEFPGVVPRTFIGALLVSTLASPMVLAINLLHLPKIYSLLAVRLALGLLILATLRFLRVQIKDKFGLQVEAFFVTLVAIQFHMLFYCTRPLPNILALGLVNLSYGYWLKGSFHATLRCLIFATIVFRCDMLLLLCPLGLELLLTKSISLWEAIKCCAGAVLFSIGLTILVDSIMWQKLLWPEFNVFWFNSVLNRSSEWGTQPFYWYFSSALPRLLLVAYPLFLFGVILDRRLLFYVLPVLSFVILYSKLPHKELRFIISSVPIFNLSAAVAASRIYNNIKKSFWNLLYIALLSLLVISLGCTAITFMASYENYPSGYALKTLHRVGHTKNTTGEIWVHIDTFSAMNGISRFCENDNQWRYSKEEGIPLEEFWQRNFTYLLNEHLSIKGFKCLFQVDGFSRIRLKVGFPPISMVKEPKVYIHGNLQNTEIMHRIWPGSRISPLKKPQFNQSIIKNRSSSSSSWSSSVSKVHSYGTVDYENKPATTVTWKAIYKRISLMGNPEKGATEVLDQWENEGKKVTKWELCRIVKELRKYGRHKLALEIYVWMNNRSERFKISSSDAAIQLDLVSKVHGMSGAEDYFKSLPNNLMDKRVYGALLNAYVRARMVEKSESLLVEMKNKDYASHALPFNVMMTLYMNLKDQEKVESLVSEMMQNNIDLDLYSYNIWISSRGSQGSIEKMEEAFEKLKLDESLNPNWTTYSTMATFYIKNREFEKAEDCLRKLETLITGRDRTPYHYLLSHYGSIGKKEEVQRIWESYKTIFPYIPNLGYHAAISSFIRMDDIEESEFLYEEWVSVKSSYDPRIGNLILSWYMRNGFVEKAETFLEEMLKVGKANSSTWEIVAEGHIKENRVSDALSCLEKASSNEGSSFWRPKPVNISALYNIYERENDENSKVALLEVLRKARVLEDGAYMSYLPFYKQAKPENELQKVKESEDDYEEAGVDMLLNELQTSI